MFLSSKIIDHHQADIATLFALGIFLFVMAFQGSRGIWERDEGRYAGIANQMLRTGDFLVPAFNDEVPHFAKPPFTYWAIAAGIKLLGRNEWGARLPNAIAFTLTALLVFLMAEKLTPIRPWLPPLIYASALFPFAAANVVTPDTLLTLWETLAVYGFVKFYLSEAKVQRKSANKLMWLGFALAFLTKGPPGLVPLLPIIVFLVLARGWRSVSTLLSVGGILIFIVIGLGWYILVVFMHKGLLTYFLRDELFRRITSSSFHRNAQWYGPFLVYFPVLLIGTLPWTLFLSRSALRQFKALLSSRWCQKTLRCDQWTVFLTLWFFIPFTIFCLSRSRLPLYILPLFVPLSIALGKSIYFNLKNRVQICFFTAWLVFLLAIKWGAANYPFKGDNKTLVSFIHQSTSISPLEVLFVDTHPMWGVGFYLGCEVESVRSKGPNGSVYVPVQGTLAEELMEKEPNTIVLVRNKHLQQVVGSFAALGTQPVILANSGKWALIAPN